MEKVKLIYNPVSGKGHFEDELGEILAALQSEGFFTDPHRLISKEDMDNAVESASQGRYSTIIVAGGDGTVNSLVNKMIKLNVDLPVYIAPAGTSNAFARGLGYSLDPADIALTLRRRELLSIDIGRANEVNFINVFAAGFPSNVAHEVETKLKNYLGVLAYGIKGLQELADMTCFKARITLKDRVIEEELLLMLILNSSMAGTLLKFAPKAKINDGLLDLLLVKSCGVQDLLPLLIKVAQGHHVGDKSFIYLQDSEFYIECLSNVVTDVDGELGPAFPLKITVDDKRIDLLKPARVTL